MMEARAKKWKIAHDKKLARLKVKRTTDSAILHKKYVTDRMKSDTNFKLAALLRKRVTNAVKRNSKAGSAVRDLGCSIDELRCYLEGKFKDGMTWENWGREGWHIDHVMPLAFFNLTNREQFLQACHYTNLQPLWAKENRKKMASIVIHSNELAR